MENLKENLRRKGWSEDEIDKTVNIIQESTGHPHYLKQRSNFNMLVYWMSLLILSICNFIISIFLVPFVVLFSSNFIYLILIVLGLIFGYLFGLTINNIEHLEKKHHVFAMILVPLLAFLNIFIIVQIAGIFDKILKMSIRHEPVLIGLVYAVFFIGPYFFFLAKEKSRIKNIRR